MFAALEKVRSNLEADVYTSEYAFQSALYNEVFGPGHDGHFVYYPDLLTAVFEWTRERALVSISEDGSSLPVIKIYGRISWSLHFFVSAFLTQFQRRLFRLQRLLLRLSLSTELMPLHTSTRPSTRRTGTVTLTPHTTLSFSSSPYMPQPVERDTSAQAVAFGKFKLHA